MASSKGEYSAVEDAESQNNSHSPRRSGRGIWPLSRKATLIIATVLISLMLLTAGSGPARNKLKEYKIPPEWMPESKEEDSHLAQQEANWTQFAYTQYVTDEDYLCNSVMMFETLHYLESKAERVMLFPRDWHDENRTDKSKHAELLRKAETEYSVKLVPVDIQRGGGEEATWAESYTKLLAFNQTDYRRVLNIDSDGTILQSMDELFLLPSATVAMPRAYWGAADKRQLSSQVMLVEPSAREFARIQKAIKKSSKDTYDMEIMNDLYYDSSMVLPHRPYDLLTGEFKKDNHKEYLGNDVEPWNPGAVYEEAKFLHFSDWPVPKPWREIDENMLQENQPKCQQVDGKENCEARDLWRAFYEEFAVRRQNICHLAPAAENKRKLARRDEVPRPLDSRIL
ncbi:MAG: N-acetylglucosaminyltransferase [Alyxoria varia]|nr:MAG: N-acetylglucosaminyltransferase [Alyxoria varia]